jgi:oligopeptide transport system permease protein
VRRAFLCAHAYVFAVKTFPGGPFTRERKLPAAIEQQLLAKYRLDGPVWQQYVDYLADVARGDLRLSTKYRDRPVRELLAQSLPVSALLGGMAFVLAVSLGVWLGSIAPSDGERWLTRARCFSPLGLSAFRPL